MKKMNPVIHFEIPADDQERMAAFYTQVFGWHTEKLGPEMNAYILAKTTDTSENGRPKTPGAINGGFYEKTKGMPNYPSVVISVDDLEASIRMVGESGGRVLGKPDLIPGVGHFIYFEDTEGNVLGMLQPQSGE
jgi:uncharacterized protein